MGPIDVADFSSFIASRFRAGNRTLSPDLAARIQELACGVAGDVQEFCAALWDVTGEGATITEADFRPALGVIFMRERKGFEKAIAHLTPTQMAVLKGLADRPGDRLYGVAFLNAVGLPNAGAVRKAVLRLEANDLVYGREDGYRFNDPFFRLWIRQMV